MSASIEGTYHYSSMNVEFKKVMDIIILESVPEIATQDVQRMGHSRHGIYRNSLP